ncbi:MAG: acetyl-CoA carboxylase biotin carboxyl carrier protein [Pseudomonadota bacterium]
MAANSKTKLDTALVRELASILQEADLGELEVEHEGTRVRVTKSAPVTVAAAVPQMPAAPPPAAAAPAPAVSAPGEALPAPLDDLSDAVTSPMVGTAYLSAEPGADLFVKVGDKVEKGQTLLLVEAMKTFNAVEAPHAGTVRQVLVTDAQPVEYGEPLMVIN